MSLYDDLEISSDADDATIKAAYRRKASKAHPDKGGSTEKFQRVQRAYAVLSDQTKRKRYDRTGESGDLPDLTALARNQISQIVMNFMLRESDPRYIDPVAGARAQIAKGMELGRVQMDQRKQLGKRLERYSKRFKYKGEQDFIKLAIAEQIRQNNAGLEADVAQIEMGKIMLKLLDDYEYETEQQKVEPYSESQMSSFTTAFRWK